MKPAGGALFDIVNPVLTNRPCRHHGNALHLCALPLPTLLRDFSRGREASVSERVGATSAGSRWTPASPQRWRVNILSPLGMGSIARIQKFASCPSCLGGEPFSAAQFFSNAWGCLRVFLILGPGNPHPHCHCRPKSRQSRTPAPSSWITGSVPGDDIGKYGAPHSPLAP